VNLRPHDAIDIGLAQLSPLSEQRGHGMDFAATLDHKRVGKPARVRHHPADLLIICPQLAESTDLQIVILRAGVGVVAKSGRRRVATRGNYQALARGLIEWADVKSVRDGCAVEGQLLDMMAEVSGNYGMPGFVD
jgi:hypothetical protein